MKKFLTITLILFTMLNLFGQKKTKIEKKFEKNISKIFPIIKVGLSENNNNNTDLELEGGEQPIFKVIAGDILCFYGIDKGDNFELLLQNQLPESIGTEELDKYAHDNLLNHIADKTEIHQTGFGGIGFSCGGNHEAALMTLPEIVDIVREKLGESIIFGVPSKDIIVFVNADNKEDVVGLKNIIELIHKDGERLLSKKLFTFENGIIKEIE